MNMDEIRNMLVGFVMVALIAGAGSMAVQKFRETTQKEDTTGITNETITISSDTGNTANPGDLFISVTGCANWSASSGEHSQMEIGTTCNVTAGTVSVSPANDSSAVLLNYTFYTPTHKRNITLSGNEGVRNTTAYFGTAGTITGVSLLLFIVVGAFVFMQRKRS